MRLSFFPAASAQSPQTNACFAKETPRPAPRTAGERAEAPSQQDIAQPKVSPESSPAANGARLSVHTAAAAAWVADERIKNLLSRLRDNFDHLEMHSEAEVPPIAVISYFATADRPAAKNIAALLDNMGYAWHIERITTQRPEALQREIELWIPSSDTALAHDRRRHHSRAGSPR